jgi:hypothetical protein
VKIEEVRAIAKSYGISPGKLPKPGLIKLIQSTEGNFDCFATAQNSECDQTSCLWRDDCFDTAKKGGLS